MITPAPIAWMRTTVSEGAARTVPAQSHGLTEADDGERTPRLTMASGKTARNCFWRPNT